MYNYIIFCFSQRYLVLLGDSSALVPTPTPTAAGVPPPAATTSVTATTNSTTAPAKGTTTSTTCTSATATSTSATSLGLDRSGPCLLIYERAVPASWGTVPLGLKSVIPVNIILSVDSEPSKSHDGDRAAVGGGQRHKFSVTTVEFCSSVPDVTDAEKDRGRRVSQKDTSGGIGGFFSGFRSRSPSPSVQFGAVPPSSSFARSRSASPSNRLAGLESAAIVMAKTTLIAYLPPGKIGLGIRFIGAPDNITEGRRMARFSVKGFSPTENGDLTVGQRAGMRVGDILERVNGVAASTREEMKRMIDELVGLEGPVELLVERQLTPDEWRNSSLPGSTLTVNASAAASGGGSAGVGISGVPPSVAGTATEIPAAATHYVLPPSQTSKIVFSVAMADDRTQWVQWVQSAMSKTAIKVGPNFHNFCS